MFCVKQIEDFDQSVGIDGWSRDDLVNSSWNSRLVFQSEYMIIKKLSIGHVSTIVHVPMRGKYTLPPQREVSE
jgi:hypothetical protein